MSSHRHEHGNNGGVLCYPRHVWAGNGGAAKDSTPAFKRPHHPVLVASLRLQLLLRAPPVTLRSPLIPSYRLLPQSDASMGATLSPPLTDGSYLDAGRSIPYSDGSYVDAGN
jgi:hypothetical protein